MQQLNGRGLHGVRSTWQLNMCKWIVIFNKNAKNDLFFYTNTCTCQII